MKGISTVIATLLMLVIAIGIVGLAYTYITGTVTVRTTTLSLVDAYCTSGTGTVTVRNDGTNDISPASVSLTSVNEACTELGMPNFPAGQRQTLSFTGCATGRTHSWRLIGPGNSFEISFFCP